MRSNLTLNSLFVAVCLCFSLVSGVSFGQTGPAPDFTLKNVDGTDVTLSSLKGKVVIIDFWAIFCPPCREEIPGFIELYNTYKDKGLEILGVFVDRDTSKVKTFVESNKINYPIIFHSKEVLEAYGGIQAIPTTFILDKDLNIVEKHVGFTEKKVFEEKIKALLGTTGSDSATTNTTNPEAQTASPSVASPSTAP